MRPAAASKAAVPEARAPAPESRQRRLRGYALIVCAAVLWASQGVFYKQLIEVYDLPPATIVFFRTALTSALLFAYVLTASWRRRQPVGVPWRDLAGFALYGLVGVAAFFMLYIHAVDAAGVSVAAVLMYTAPAWVVGISVLFLGERLTRRKAAALALAIGGAALVSGVYQVESLHLNAAGVLFGLGAGLGYGLYTVFNKVALRRYPPWTVLAYALGFGTLFPVAFPVGRGAGARACRPRRAPVAVGRHHPHDAARQPDLCHRIARCAGEQREHRVYRGAGRRDGLRMAALQRAPGLAAGAWRRAHHRRGDRPGAEIGPCGRS
ncbi:MAG: DMT family transporter [Anaerolineae bacterium]|nr:DMT family transporter [Anaerolineae bacterium]